MKNKRYEDLQIKDDFMFGMIMRNPKYCKPFLEIVLNEKIKTITYPKTQFCIDNDVHAKGIRLDVYIDDTENTVYNIEMQSHQKAYLPKRIRYYHSMIDLDLLEKGMDYTELKKSVVIFVCTFDFVGKGLPIYTFEQRCKEDPFLSLQDNSTTIILNTKSNKNNITPRLRALLEYIDGKQPSDDYTKELDVAVKKAKTNKDWKVIYMKMEADLHDAFVEGQAQGISQGISQGIEKKHLEDLMKLAIEYKKDKTSALYIAGVLGIAEDELLGFVEKRNH